METTGGDEEMATGPESEERRGTRQRMSDGIKQGIGVLSAFKDALEETIQEARERGDLSTDRAKSVMKDALGRAQTAASGAREKLDFVHQSELDALRAQIEALQNRVELLEGRFSAPADLGKPPAEDRE
jgi:polyhydroxyalkanoate synthesis regulator phasin